MDLQAVQLYKLLTVGCGVPFFPVSHCPSHLTVGCGSIVSVIFTVGCGTHCSLLYIYDIRSFTVHLANELWYFSLYSKWTFTIYSTCRIVEAETHTSNNAYVRRNPNANFSTRGQNQDLVHKIYKSWKQSKHQ